jgi:hypothetical protein
MLFKVIIVVYSEKPVSTLCRKRQGKLLLKQVVHILTTVF